VNREENTDGFRAAQLPSAGQPADDGLSRPFADDPQAPPELEQPDFDKPSPPNNAAQTSGNVDPVIPAPQNNQQLPVDGQEMPDTSLNAAPGTGQFQPILPAGPGPDQSPPTPASTTDAAALAAEGEKAQESCDKSLENLRAYTVDKVQLTIAITGTAGEDFPFECSIDDGQMFAGRCWDQTTYMWKASAMCHKPLYFEDEQLERYGHSFTPCIQPFVSGAHFFCTLPVLPYCMGVEPPCECIYALGHYRPGSCAPYMCNPVPLSLRGALFEAGAVTGTAAAIP
jgi:hypothetical protein